MTPLAAAAAMQAAAPVLTMGVEEEFFLLRPDGSAASVAPQLIAELSDDAHVHPEWMQFQIETVTGVCHDLPSVVHELATKRREVGQAAGNWDAQLVATGTPPFGVPGIAARTDDDRFQWLQDRFPQAAAEVVSCGCHVHVGVPSRELGVETLNRLRGWLPVLLALSCNSPLWRGHDSGWESWRHQMFSRWPSARLPPRCADPAAYDAALDQCIAAGEALDASGVYWFARLSPRYPTVEIRIADADAALLAGLCRALVATSIAEAVVGATAEPMSEVLLEKSLRSAARRGLDAQLVDPRNGTLAPGYAVLYRFVEHLTPALVAAGDYSAVTALLAERRVRRSGAQRQRLLGTDLDREAYVTALARLSVPGRGGLN